MMANALQKPAQTSSSGQPPTLLHRSAPSMPNQTNARGMVPGKPAKGKSVPHFAEGTADVPDPRAYLSIAPGGPTVDAPRPAPAVQPGAPDIVSNFVQAGHAIGAGIKGAIGIPVRAATPAAPAAPTPPALPTPGPLPLHPAMAADALHAALMPASYATTRADLTPATVLSTVRPVHTAAMPSMQAMYAAHAVANPERHTPESFASATHGQLTLGDAIAMRNAGLMPAVPDQATALKLSAQNELLERAKKTGAQADYDHLLRVFGGALTPLPVDATLPVK